MTTRSSAAAGTRWRRVLRHRDGSTIRRSALEWVRAFHADYYAPSNAVLAIVGDFEEAEAMALVKQWFGDAKRESEVPT